MNTREIALVSLFSAVWVTSQIYLGPVIGQATTLHGLVQRFMGWFLMLVLAEIIGRFGRVSLMAAIAALATRMIRYSASLYVWVVGLGYALGGLAFDALFFIPLARGFRRGRRTGYLVGAALVSGVLASLPYFIYRLISYGPVAFLVWLPVNLPKEFIDIGLNILGTLTAVAIVPKVKTILPTLQVEARA